jgi:hypothetical protein
MRVMDDDRFFVQILRRMSLIIIIKYKDPVNTTDKYDQIRMVMIDKQFGAILVSNAWW